MAVTMLRANSTLSAPEGIERGANKDLVYNAGSFGR